MLTDQGSAYVGRFARGWLRLPERRSPGNHRPGREPTAEYRSAIAPDAARAAVNRLTSRAPADTSCSAHAPAVAPVVSTSSTSNTRLGTSPTGSNSPRIATRRSSPLRRACDTGGSPVRTRSDLISSDRRRATARANARAWSYPRAASRRFDNGTHVTASTSASSTSPIAAPNASATGLHPANFNRCTARRTGPSNKNGARAEEIETGGQCRHPSIDRLLGTPHRTHQGGPSTTIAARHPEQNGQEPDPHPAHRRGNNASSTIERATLAAGADTGSVRSGASRRLSPGAKLRCGTHPTALRPVLARVRRSGSLPPIHPPRARRGRRGRPRVRRRRSRSRCR